MIENLLLKINGTLLKDPHFQVKLSNEGLLNKLANFHPIINKFFVYNNDLFIGEEPNFDEDLEQYISLLSGIETYDNYEQLLEATKLAIYKGNYEQYIENSYKILENGNISALKHLKPPTLIDVEKDHSSFDLAKDNLDEYLQTPYINLLKLNDEALDFFKSTFCPSNLVCFMGAEKRGKSFILFNLLRISRLSGVKTTLIQAGDLTEKDFIVRFGSMTLHREEFDFKNDIKMIKKANKIINIPLNIHTFSMGLCELSHIEEIIQRDCPEVLVLDYADLLVNNSKDDSRGEHNRVWSGLRRLAMKYNVCIITASQVNAKAYKSGLLNKSHFSEDKRKLAHCTQVFGLNPLLDDAGEEIEGIGVNCIVNRYKRMTSNLVLKLEFRKGGRLL